MRWMPIWRAVVFLFLSLGVCQNLSRPGLARDVGGDSGIVGAVPRLVRFSGVVTGQGRSPASGISRFTFSIYEEQAGGAALWNETQDVRLDAQGRYSVLLGAASSDGLPAELFSTSGARWLGVTTEGRQEDSRVLLVAVPYALKAADADTLGGKPATAFVASDQLKDQVRDEVKTQVTESGSATRTLIGTDPTPQALGETQSSFVCNLAADCVAVTQSGSGIGLHATVPSNSAVQGELTGTAGAGVYGRATAASGATNAVQGDVASTVGVGVLGRSFATTGVSKGVFGRSFSTSGIGVHGDATATSGATRGVWGTTVSNGGVGVYGQSASPTGFTTGVTGTVASTTGVGMLGIANAVTGSTVGMQAKVYSADGTALIVDNTAAGRMISARVNGVEKLVLSGNGSLGIGTSTPAAKLHVLSSASGSTAIIADAPFDGKIFSGQKYGIEQFRVDGTGNVVAKGIMDAVNLHADTGVTALGMGANINGGSNTAIGYYTLASDTSGGANAAVGYFALNRNTTGNFNTAFGREALLLNDAGSWNTAVGYCALQNVNAPVDSAGSCIATDNTTAGRGNIGIGLGSGSFINTGSYNTFLGYRADANLHTDLVNATAIGAEAVVGASNSIVLGSIAGQNGASSGVNVGIGTITPGDFLDVETAGTFNDNGITIEGSPSTYGDLGLKIHNKAAGGVNWYLDSTSNGSGWSGGGYLAIGPGPGVFPTMFIHSGPHVGIGTGALDHPFTICAGCGVAYADGWAAFSSRRFKTNIQTLHNALGTVARLRGVSYNDKSNGKPEVGVIAEEVAQVLPQVVGIDKAGKADGVDYSRLTAVLIEATKEQQAEIRKLRRQAAEKDAQVRKQQEDIRSLTRKVEGLRQTTAELKTLEARLARLEMASARERTPGATPAARAGESRLSPTLAKVRF